ncbi:hypothetical protein Q3G72_022149 [Acer saccharum]|nr:hypothetical protein Q3G72_022149 [Acer saccharum]
MEMEMVTSREKNGTRKLKLESTVAGSEMEFEWQMPMNQPAAAMQSDTDNMKWRSADNGNLAMFDIVCDTQARRVKAVAEASHRDAADQKVSGIVPPQDYGTSNDVGVEEDPAVGVFEGVPQSTRVKSSGPITDKENKQSGSAINKGKEKVQVGPVVKELVGLVPKVDPINDPNIRKDHPPLVSRSSPTLMSEDPIVPSLEAGGPFKAIPTEISDEGSIPVRPWPSSEGSSLPLSQPRGPSP